MRLQQLSRDLILGHYKSHFNPLAITSDDRNQNEHGRRMLPQNNMLAPTD